MDYNRYTFTLPEKVKILLLSVGSMAAISYLFYNSWLCLLATPVCAILLSKRWQKQGVVRQQSLIAQQFLDAMQVVSNCLLSGYSMENAWREAEKELATLHGSDALMTKELHRMNQSVGLNVSLEQLFEDFSERAGVEDIQSFSEVFVFARKSGGNMVHIIETTTYHMRAKQEVGRELEILIASKKLEQNIMNVMPLFILVYLRVSAFDYIELLYGNLFGVVFMSICLAVYIIAVYLSEQIMRIQV